jgi:hypothetical protein
MKRIKSLSRLVIAGLMIVALISGAFLGATSTTVYAEGGGNGPMPGDTNPPATCAINPEIGTEIISTWSLVLFVMKGVF